MVRDRDCTRHASKQHPDTKKKKGPKGEAEQKSNDKESQAKCSSVRPERGTVFESKTICGGEESREKPGD